MRDTHQSGDRGRSRFSLWVSRWLYPVLLLGGAGTTWGLMNASLPHFISVTCVTSCAGAILWGLERWIPCHAAWRPSLRESVLDLSHLFVSTGLTTIVVNATILGGVVWVGVLLSQSLGGVLWPIHWPWGIQMALGLLLGELGAYWAHRVCHLSPFWWRIHVLHHSSEKLHVWAAGRNHPLNVVCTVTLQSALPPVRA